MSGPWRVLRLQPADRIFHLCKRVLASSRTKSTTAEMCEECSFFGQTSVNKLLTQFDRPCLQPAALQFILFTPSWTCLTLERLIVIGCCLTHSLDFNCLVVVLDDGNCGVLVSRGHGECHVQLQRLSRHVLDEILVPWCNGDGVVLLVRAPLPSFGSPCRSLKAMRKKAHANTEPPASTAHSTRCSFPPSRNPSGDVFRRSVALTRPARCRSDLQAEELLKENRYAPCSRSGKHTVVHHRTGRVAIHELLFAQRHTITFQALSAGVTLSLLRHQSHHRAASLAAALHPGSVCCTTGLCDLVKGSLTTSLCVVVTPAFQTSVNKVFSSSLGPSWRLGLLHALDTALDRRVVVHDGVVILGRGVTVLRYHVRAMSAPSCQLGSFHVVLLVFRLCCC